MTRRELLACTAGTMALAPAFTAEVLHLKDALKQSICRWCYGKIPLEKLVNESKKMGYKSIELISKPEEVKLIQDAGMTVAVYGAASIPIGWNRKENHAPLIEKTKKDIDIAAQFKLTNVIVMSGNRTMKGVTVSDDEGLDNCASGLKEILGYAESKGITLVMEGLNSKRDHKDYMYDRTAWGVKLCKKLGSTRFKLLYDIYHMQIMEGDVLATIRENREFIGHYHTGGVPGRNEIDETQELNYPLICKSIVDSGYQGYLGQEFIPKRDPFHSLEQAHKICDV